MKNTQKGSALIFTLIVLVALLFGSIALFRNTDAASMVAANLAFKDVSVKAADLAIIDATAYINGMVAVDTDDAPKYYALQRLATADGIVCSKPLTGGGTCGAADMDWGVPTIVGNNKVYYVVDRLCEAFVPGTDVNFSCLIDMPPDNDSKKGGVSLTSTAISTTSIYYRVTIKVLGASNTESYVQVVVTKQI